MLLDVFTLKNKKETKKKSEKNLCSKIDAVL